MAERKTTAGTTGAKKASTAKKATAPRTTTPRTTKKPQYIRNLLGTVVHLRLLSQNPKDPFRIELKPRGIQGDTSVVPVSLQGDPTYLKAVGRLIENITESEYRQLQYGPVGYLGRDDAPILIRPEDTTIATADDWDGQGRRVPAERNVQGKIIKRSERGSQYTDREVGTGMHVVDLPGSDSALAADVRAAALSDAAMPPGVDTQSRRVSIQHVRGE